MQNPFATCFARRRVFRGVKGRTGGVERTETFDVGQEGMEADEGKAGGGTEDVQHLVLVVHGIGAQLQAFDLIGLVQLKSIIECCSWMRANHTEVSGDLGFTGRVEYIPIEWHERFNRVSRQNDPNVPGAGLDDISLDTIPHLRR